jgi:putative membrane protein
MMYHGHGMGAGWIVMVVAVALPALLIGAALLLAQLGRAPAGPPIPDPVQDAQRVLADRFARGEIGAEEYDQRLFTLRVARI